VAVEAGSDPGRGLQYRIIPMSKGRGIRVGRVVEGLMTKSDKGGLVEDFADLMPSLPAWEVKGKDAAGAMVQGQWRATVEAAEVGLKVGDVDSKVKVMVPRAGIGIKDRWYNVVRIEANGAKIFQVTGLEPVCAEVRPGKAGGHGVVRDVDYAVGTMDPGTKGRWWSSADHGATIAVKGLVLVEAMDEVLKTETSVHGARVLWCNAGRWEIIGDKSFEAAGLASVSTEVKVLKADGHGTGRVEAWRTKTSAPAVGIMSAGQWSGAGRWRIIRAEDFGPVGVVEVFGVEKKLRRVIKVKASVDLIGMIDRPRSNDGA
jgi:hypothetical protein